MGDNHRGVCFLKDEKTMRVYGVADKPHYMDISNEGYVERRLCSV